MKTIRMTARQVVFYDQTREVTDEEAAKVLAAEEDGDTETLARFADVFLDKADISDGEDIAGEDVSVELVKPPAKKRGAKRR